MATQPSFRHGLAYSVFTLLASIMVGTLAPLLHPSVCLPLHSGKRGCFFPGPQPERGSPMNHELGWDFSTPHCKQGGL